jgi:CTP synthase
LANNAKVVVKYLDVEDETLESQLLQVDGILIPGGFGDRGVEGKIAVAKFARERQIPFFGICLGMQCAVIDVARHVAKLGKAHSTEFAPKTPHPVVDMMLEQKKVTQLGASMRLGVYPCRLKADSLARKAYGGPGERTPSSSLRTEQQISKGP